MRYFGFILLFFCSLFSIAQIPAGYYDNAEGKTREELKTALYNIIKGHTEYPYTSSSTDTWDILKETDRDPNNSNNVIGIYSGFSMDGPKEYNNGSGWNREHVWAKSRGDFGTSRGAGTDVHHLRAADISTNSARSNRNFNECDKRYVDGDGSTDSYTCTSEFSWEPADNVKGDVARMLFYMATRYEGQSGEPDLELTDVLQTNTSKSPLHAMLSVLLVWHVQDPVDEMEQNRNDIIYGYQRNRNPFIDHPEYVDMIWGEEEEVLAVDIEETIAIYPNPSTHYFRIKAESKPVRVILYDQQGRVVRTFERSSERYRVRSLAEGVYNVWIEFDRLPMAQKQLIIK